MAKAIPINAITGPIIPQRPEKRDEMRNSTTGCKGFRFSVSFNYTTLFATSYYPLRIEDRDKTCAR